MNRVKILWPQTWRRQAILWRSATSPSRGLKRLINERFSPGSEFRIDRTGRSCLHASAVEIANCHIIKETTEMITLGRIVVGLFLFIGWTNNAMSGSEADIKKAWETAVKRHATTPTTKTETPLELMSKFPKPASPPPSPRDWIDALNEMQRTNPISADEIAVYRVQYRQWRQTMT
jgi:hypothetical protein